MKVTLTYEDITEEELQEIINQHLDTKLFFSKRRELIKQGETNIKKMLIRLIENMKKQLEWGLYTDDGDKFVVKQNIEALERITYGDHTETD